VNTIMNLEVPRYAWKFLSGSTIGDLSRRAQLIDLVSYLAS
jgi:hypothetical protein